MKIDTAGFSETLLTARLQIPGTVIYFLRPEHVQKLNFPAA
jgi:hypothetical protein